MKAPGCVFRDEGGSGLHPGVLQTHSPVFSLSFHKAKLMTGSLITSHFYDVVFTDPNKSNCYLRTVFHLPDVFSSNEDRR